MVAVLDGKLDVSLSVLVVSCPASLRTEEKALFVHPRFWGRVRHTDGPDEGLWFPRSLEAEEAHVVG